MRRDTKKEKERDVNNFCLFKFSFQNESIPDTKNPNKIDILTKTNKTAVHLRMRVIKERVVVFI
jgi:hypothetical protein